MSYLFSRSSRILSSLLPVLLLSIGCASSLPTYEGAPERDAEREAQELLGLAIAAQGGDLYAEVKDIAVAYEGSWWKAVQRVQPVLTDVGHRRSSEERLLLAAKGRSGDTAPSDTLAQEHQGPAGRKWVLRRGREVEVRFTSADEREASEEEVAAAALVADVYRMFLTGPSFFRRQGTTLWPMPPIRENGKTYMRLAALLEPGFGFSERDRAVLWIDSESHRLYRTQFSIEGLDSTRGAEVDTTYSGFREVGGYVWPTEFFERVRAPLRLKAHRWQIRGLDLNRGLGEEDLAGGFSPRAARPAQPLD